MHLTSVHPQFYTIDSGDQDSAIISMIAPYKSELDSSMNEVIGYSEVSLIKSRPEMTLGYWMCDAIARQVGLVTSESIDFVAINYGGIRLSELAPGPVTVGEMYELMPFDNQAVIVHASGNIVLQFAEEMAKHEGWPVSSHFRMQVRQGRAMHVAVNGEPIDQDREYRFVVPDFIANGGDNIEILRDLPREIPGMLVRDALISEVMDQAAQGKGISAVNDGRVTRNGD